MNLYERYENLKKGSIISLDQGFLYQVIKNEPGYAIRLQSESDETNIFNIYYTEINPETDQFEIVT